MMSRLYLSRKRRQRLMEAQETITCAAVAALGGGNAARTMENGLCRYCLRQGSIRRRDIGNDDTGVMFQREKKQMQNEGEREKNSPFFSHLPIFDLPAFPIHSFSHNSIYYVQISYRYSINPGQSNGSTTTTQGIYYIQIPYRFTINIGGCNKRRSRNPWYILYTVFLSIFDKLSYIGQRAFLAARSAYTRYILYTEFLSLLDKLLQSQPGEKRILAP